MSRIFHILFAGFILATVAAKAEDNGEDTQAEATKTRAAIKAGDFAQAEKIIARVKSVSKLDSFDYQPFSNYIRAINPDKDDDDYREGIDRWVLQSPQSSAAWLMHGRYYFKSGWRARGSGFVDSVRQSGLNRFTRYMKTAWDDFTKSIAIDGSVPYAYYERLNAAIGYDNAHQEQAFDEGIKHFPDYYPLYTERLYQLTPKWGGSIYRMIAFTFRYSANVPDNSPRRMLPIQLYTNLAIDAGINCGEQGSAAYDSCQKGITGMLQGPEMQKKLTEAFDLSSHMDKPSYNSKLMAALGCDCHMPVAMMAPFYNLAVTKLGRENFGLNYGEGDLYYINYNFTAATPFFTAALQESRQFPFTNQNTRNWVISTIDEKLADISFRTFQYKKGEDYASDALALEKNNSLVLEHRCEIRSAMSKLEDALADCSESLALRDYSYVRWLRGQVFQKLHRLKEAKADYQAALAMHDSQSDNLHPNVLNALSIVEKTTPAGSP